MGINAATQKAVADGVRAATEDTQNADMKQGCDQQQQQQQIEAVECPANQQASSGKQKKKQRKGKSTADTVLVATAEAGEADGESRSQPGSCQAAEPSMQKGSTALHRTQHKAATVRTSAFKQRPDALAKQICPAYDNPAVHVLSLCHMPDEHAAHSCKTNADCGVDSVTCRDRACSVHAFCQEDPK